MLKGGGCTVQCEALGESLHLLVLSKHRRDDERGHDDAVQVQ